MRVFLLSTLTVVLFLGGAGVGTAQTKDKDKDKDKEKKAEWPAEIGGKTVGEWIDAIAQRDRAKSVAAMKTVLMFGPKKALKAVPVILDELRKHKPPGKPVDASFCVTAPAVLHTIMSGQEKPDEKLTKEVIDVLKVMLKDRQLTIRYRTLQALSLFGPYIKDFVPELIERVKDVDTWEMRFLAVTTLGNYPLDRDKEGRPKEPPPNEVSTAILKQMLADSSSQVRLAALHAVDRLDLPDFEKTKQAVDLYIVDLLDGPKGFKNLKETDPVVRINGHLIAYSIDKNKQKDRRKAISTYLTHKETAVRVEAIQALARIGKDARDQVVRLAECLEEKDEKGHNQEPAVRAAAFQALAHIGAEDASIAAMIAAYIGPNQKKVEVRVTALAALSGMGKSAKAHVNRIAGFVKDEDADLQVRVAAIQALANLGTLAGDRVDVITPLIGAKGAKDQPLRLAAIQALGVIDPDSRNTMTLLTECLKDKDLNVVGTAILALGRLGKKEALSSLREVAANKVHPPQLCLEAQQAIDHIIETNKKTTKKGEKG